MKSDHPMMKLRVALDAAMEEVKTVPFGPTGHVGLVLSGREHRTDEAQLSKFEDIVRWLAQMTFGQSDCDMPWAEVHIIDRTRNESSGFAPLPYSHKLKHDDDEAHWRIVQLAEMNLAIAANRLDTAMRVYQDVREKSKRKAAPAP